MELKEIADITTGVTVRSKTDIVKDGEFRIIQMSDISESDICLDKLAFVNKKINNNQILEAGDILFKSRGSNNTAALFNLDNPNVTSISTLFRVRVKKAHSQKVKPEYLLWFINSDISQDYFRRHTKGSYISMIDKETLGKLKVHIPDSSVQDKIGKLNQLIEEESRIHFELAKKRKEYFNCELRELIGVGS